MRAILGDESKSAIQAFLNMFRHRIDCRVQLFLHHHHIFLVIFRDQVYRQPDLPETPTPPDSVQIGRRIFRKVEVYHDVHTWHVNTSRNEVGADQCFKFSFPKPLKDLQPLIFHCWSEVFILEPFAFHLLGEELSSLIGATKDDTLVDNEFTVYFIQVLKLLWLFDENVVMGESKEHELIHQIDDLGRRHETLFKPFDSKWECCRVEI